MYNIKQITNYNFTSSPITSFYTITDIPHNITIEGKLINNYPYKRITFNKNIPKFGYCCEPKALLYPIYLDNKEFQIGKTGMFEIQPEIWYDMNDDESYEQEMEVTITSIDIPCELKFKLDFIYPDN